MQCQWELLRLASFHQSHEVFVFSPTPSGTTVTMMELPVQSEACCSSKIMEGSVNLAGAHPRSGECGGGGGSAAVRYVGWSYVFEKCRVLHETGAAVLVGLVAGQVMKTCFGTTATFSGPAEPGAEG